MKINNTENRKAHTVTLTLGGYWKQKEKRDGEKNIRSSSFNPSSFCRKENVGVTLLTRRTVRDTCV